MNFVMIIIDFDMYSFFIRYSDARKDLQKINVYTFILGILL